MIGYYWVTWTNGTETIERAQKVWAYVNDKVLATQIESIATIGD